MRIRGFKVKGKYEVYLMQDHGFVGEINKWLGDTECQWPQTCAKTSNKNKRLHFLFAPFLFC